MTSLSSREQEEVGVLYSCESRLQAAVPFTSPMPPYVSQLIFQAHLPENPYRKSPNPREERWLWSGKIRTIYGTFILISGDPDQFSLLASSLIETEIDSNMILKDSALVPLHLPDAGQPAMWSIATYLFDSVFKTCSTVGYKEVLFFSPHGLKYIRNAFNPSSALNWLC